MKSPAVLRIEKGYYSPYLKHSLFLEIHSDLNAHTHTYFEDRQNLEKGTLQNESNNDVVLKEKGKTTRHKRLRTRQEFRWLKINYVHPY